MNKFVLGLTFTTLSTLSIAATGCAAEATEANDDANASALAQPGDLCANAGKSIESCKKVPGCTPKFKSNVTPGNGPGVPSGNFGPPRLEKCVERCSLKDSEASCRADIGCAFIPKAKCPPGTPFCEGSAGFACINAGCTGLSKSQCKANPACKEVLGEVNTRLNGGSGAAHARTHARPNSRDRFSSLSCSACRVTRDSHQKTWRTFVRSPKTL
jgi:hypothetical protein